MQFGTLILSKKRSIQKHWNEVTLHVGKFIIQRPDNGRFIFEVGDVLLQDEPENIFLLNTANLEYFKDLIVEGFNIEIQEQEKTIQSLKNIYEDMNVKVKELQELIQNVEKKNIVEFSKNREKTLRELGKSLRKHEKRVGNTEQAVREAESKKKTVKSNKACSLERIDKHMKQYLNV